jgi:hypothetical protein
MLTSASPTSQAGLRQQPDGVTLGCRAKPQVAVDDLELQAPTASTIPPGGRPAFQAVLGAFGHAPACSALLTMGLDLMHCLHQV